MSHAAFQHEVLLYRDADEFLAGTVPHLRSALEAGGLALVAVRRTRAVELKGELGEDAARVHFADMEELGRNPARIIPFWREYLDRHGTGNRPLKGIGEPVWPGRSLAELDECRRHEQLLDVAFDGQPPWSLLCPYDCSSLADDVLEQAVQNHPFLAGRRGSEPNLDRAGAGPPGEVFAGRLAEPPASARNLEFGRGDLSAVRAVVAGEAERAGFTAERASDLVTAASELAANSIIHAGGRGTVSVWADDGDLVVEVEDAGQLDDALVGRRRPRPTQEGGRGIWIANLLCDLVQIRSGPWGTTIRLRMSIRP